MNAVRETVRFAKRVAIAVVGATVLLIGIVMIVTPGPAFVLIPVGLAILGLEFAWARLWLSRLREKISAKNSANHAERAEEHRRRPLP
jgi:tellurite resistance protein TerC